MKASSSSTSGPRSHFGLDPFDRLACVQSRARQQTECGLQRFDRLAWSKSAPFETHAVGAEHLDLRLLAVELEKGITSCLTTLYPPMKRVPADAAKLVHAAECADGRRCPRRSHVRRDVTRYRALRRCRYSHRARRAYRSSAGCRRRSASASHRPLCRGEWSQTHGSCSGCRCA